MAEDKFKPGSMNVEEHEKTFVGFMKWVTNTSIVIIVVLLFLAVFAI